MSLRRIIVPRHLTLDYLEGIMDCTLKNIGKFFFVIITTTPRILEKHIVINFRIVLMGETMAQLVFYSRSHSERIIVWSRTQVS